jgi:hypothetical protein
VPGARINHAAGRGAVIGFAEFHRPAAQAGRFAVMEPIVTKHMTTAGPAMHSDGGLLDRGRMLGRLVRRRCADAFFASVRLSARLTIHVLDRYSHYRRLSRGFAVATTIAKWVAIAAFALYVGAVGYFYIVQRSLMYFPETVHTAPAAAGLPEAQEVPLTAADGTGIFAWHIPPREGRPVIVYFHGNGGALRYRAARFRRLATEGIGLVAVEYRGFGGLSGSPTEDGLIADGKAAYQFAAARYPVDQIVLWGESLGSGVAVALAAQEKVARVILEAPFTSTAAVGAIRYWYIPVRLLMKDQFRSDLRIGQVTAPVLILHGARDRIVPYAMGERLFELVTAPKHIVRFLDGDHDDLDNNGAFHAIARFLAGDLDKPPVTPKFP